MIKKSLIMILFLIIPIVNAGINVHPTSWEINTHPLSTISQTFTFTSDSNITTSLAFTKSGTNTNWLNLSKTTAPVSDNTSAELIATVNVPSTADEDTYIMKIRYDSSEIPIILTVTSNITESIGKCRLDITPNSYSLPIVQGSPPASQLFTVYVVKYCEEEVNIKTPLIIGNTQTQAGSKPLSIMGGIDLGFTEPRNEGTFTVQMDVTDLPIGTYQPYILVDGYYKGEKITSKINFNIQVSTGASPIESASALPTYIFSATDLLLNNSYTITAQNYNPNYEPYVIPSEYFYGEKLDIASGWVYYFRPNKVGNFKMTVYTTFKNVPIGNPTEQEMRVTASSISYYGTSIKFRIFPENIDNLKNGDTVTVLIEENKTGTIIEDRTLYLNGNKLDTNSFTVEAGKTYRLSCSSSGFTSIHREFTVPYQMVSISYEPYDVEINRNVTFITNPDDAQLYLGDSLIGKTHIFTTTGSYTLISKASGYQDTNLVLYVTEPLQLLSEIPKKIKVGEEVIIEFNKIVEWEVKIKENINSTPIHYDGGSGESFVRFIPKEKYIYEFFIRGELMAVWDLTGWNLNFKNIFIFIVVIGLIVGVVYVGNQRGWFKNIGKGGGREKEIPKSKFELDIPASGEVIE